MKDKVARFRNDFYNAVSELAKQLWLKMTVGYFITIMNVYFVIFGGVALLIGLQADTVNSILSMSTDPTAANNIMLSIFQSDGIGKMIFLAVFVFIVTLAGAWSMVFFFKLGEETVVRSEANLGDCLKKSLHWGVFRIIGLGICAYLLMGIAAGIVFGLSMIHWSLGVLAAIGLWFAFFKFLIAIPAILIGGNGVIDALLYSWKRISYVRAFKYAIILFVLVLVFELLVMLMAMFVGLLALIPYLGIVIQFVFMALIGGYMLSFVVSAITAMYYKHSSDEDIEILDGAVESIDGEEDLLDAGLV